MYSMAKAAIMEMEPKKTFTATGLALEIIEANDGIAKMLDETNGKSKAISDVRYAINDLRKKGIIASTNIKNADNLMIYQKIDVVAVVEKPSEAKPPIPKSVYKISLRKLIHDMIAEGVHHRKNILNAVELNGHKRKTASDMLSNWQLLKPHGRSPYKEVKKLVFDSDKIASWVSIESS